MLAKLLILTGFVSTGLLLIVLTATTPSDSGAFGILAVFLLGYIVCLVFLTFLVWIIALLVNKAGKRVRFSRKADFMTLKKAYYYSSVIAFGPVIVISLQSVGGVGVYEAGLIGLFILLGCIYVSRRAA